MPEAATAEEIETVYLEGWKQGLKAIAIYRDGSKRSQPLSTGKKKDGEAELTRPSGRDDREPAQAARGGPGRGHPPAPPPAPRRADRADAPFDIAGHEGYITVGLYPDGQPGEIFLKMAKEGSTISGLMDTLATSVSLALQYGVPLKDVVNKFAHVRFEPSGFTGNPEIPIAKSLVDYIFRWLGSRFLENEDKGVPRAHRPVSGGHGRADRVRRQRARAAVERGHHRPVRGSHRDGAGHAGSLRPRSRRRPTTRPRRRRSRPPRRGPGVGAKEELAVVATNGAANGHATSNGNGKRTLADFTGSLGGSSLGGGVKVAFSAQADAPSCAECGSIMIRNGSCYKCLNCGSTSGCS